MATVVIRKASVVAVAVAAIGAQGMVTPVVAGPGQATRAATSATYPRAAAVPKAVNGKKITKKFRAAINGLPVRGERRNGYAREKFKLWDDVDRDCQDARSEVLRQESKKKVTGNCAAKSGKWVSQYDGVTKTKAKALDIDHMVPLAEAWDSGARNWNPAHREAYANDLTDGRSLIAVTASSNRSKGDRDPGEWMPIKYPCKYIRQWTVVKLRWGLSVDQIEKESLLLTAQYCDNKKFTTHLAKVKMVGGSSGGGTGGGGGGGGGGIDPRFSTCTEAISHGYGPYYRGRDPEYWWYEDRDHDGIVCE